MDLFGRKEEADVIKIILVFVAHVFAIVAYATVVWTTSNTVFPDLSMVWRCILMITVVASTGVAVWHSVAWMTGMSGTSEYYFK